MDLKEKLFDKMHNILHKRTIPTVIDVKKDRIMQRIIEKLQANGFVGKKIKMLINDESSEYDFYFMYKIVKKSTFFSVGAIEMYLFSEVQYITEDLYTEFAEYNFFDVHEELEKDIKNYRHKNYREGLIFVCNINQENEFSDKYIYESLYDYATATALLPVCIIEKKGEIMITTTKTLSGDVLYKGLKKDFESLVKDLIDEGNDNNERNC